MNLVLARHSETLKDMLEDLDILGSLPETATFTSERLQELCDLLTTFSDEKRQAIRESADYFNIPWLIDCLKRQGAREGIWGQIGTLSRCYLCSTEENTSTHWFCFGCRKTPDRNFHHCDQCNSLIQKNLTYHCLQAMQRQGQISAYTMFLRRMWSRTSHRSAR